MNWMRKPLLLSIVVRSENVWAHTDRKGRYQKVIRELHEEKKRLENSLLTMLLEILMVKLKPELVKATGASTLASEASWPVVGFTMAVLLTFPSFAK